MTSGIHFGEPGRVPCSARQRVYGYVRAFDPYQLALERRSIQGFCQRMNIDLVRIIEDPCQSDEIAPCGSFLELTCALELEPVYGVVMPELAHLSPNKTVQALRLQWITSLKREVFVVPNEPAGFRETGA
ncbi:hypothetical protein SK803_46190 [Lentzea sp. BCCO 10_0856]|uniref:Resolvase/invertase-type recombinase catalytic domain-containing protein n=1 Tax=Lentzea miocenica TaxID=3095431 RepID=A0ABU4THL9_9PSEU|nr:hypothetical protein [Lentzea sp. BCCO 10_0856]MDX8037631.1 hypothetical protein [Lentzea sp. BCCO 10_0856]